MKGFCKKLAVSVLLCSLLCGCGNGVAKRADAQPVEDELEIGM